MPKVNVQVSEENKKNGVMKDSCKCPVALALSEVLSENVLIQVFEFSITIEDRKTFPNGELVQRIELPKFVSDWIDDFDNPDKGLFELEPLEFELEIEHEEFLKQADKSI